MLSSGLPGAKVNGHLALVCVVWNLPPANTRQHRRVGAPEGELFTATVERTVY